MSSKTKLDDLQNILFYALGVVVFCMFVFLTVWGDDGLMKLVDLKTQKKNFSQQNVEILQQNLMRVEEIEKLKSARYLKQIARSELGLVKPDEVVFIIQ